MAIKEGSELDDDQLDTAEGATLAADEALLLWLGGFALQAAMKVHSQPALSVFRALIMPTSEKSNRTTCQAISNILIKEI